MSVYNQLINVSSTRVGGKRRKTHGLHRNDKRLYCQQIARRGGGSYVNLAHSKVTIDKESDKTLIAKEVQCQCGKSVAAFGILINYC